MLCPNHHLLPCSLLLLSFFITPHPDRIRHKLGAFPATDGSAYMEIGLNKVLVVVTGPMEPRRAADALSDKAFISVHLSTAAFSGNDHKKRRLNDRRSLDMESVLRKTFEGTVMLEQYPRSEIHITVHLIESDGSVICALINAVTLALMDAGVSMVDMVTACSVGQVRGKFCADVNQVEQNAGGAYLPLAVRARSEEILFLQLDSRLSIDLFGDALDVALEGCRRMRTYMEASTKRCIEEAFAAQRL